MKEQQHNFLGVRAGYPLNLFFVKNKKKDTVPIPNAKSVYQSKNQ